MSEPVKPPQYEPADARPGIAAATAGALALITFGSILVGLGIAGHRNGYARPGPDQFFQHGPRERTSIQNSWEKLDAAAGANDGYGWVDRKRGVVRIPIARAIELLCAEQAGRAASAGQPTPSP